LNDGQACTPGGTPCLNGCTQWFPDNDPQPDGFGSNSGSINRCGTTPPSGGRFVRQGGDCCDSDGDAHPGQQLTFTRERNGCGGFDFNCNGFDEPEYRGVGGGAVIDNILTGFASCEDLGNICGEFITLIWPGGQPAPCGSTGAQGTGGSQCFLVDGVCQGVRGFGVDVFCK
jgi:hypothetical protein